MRGQKIVGQLEIVGIKRVVLVSFRLFHFDCFMLIYFDYFRISRLFSSSYAYSLAAYSLTGKNSWVSQYSNFNGITFSTSHVTHFDITDTTLIFLAEKENLFDTDNYTFGDITRKK